MVRNWLGGSSHISPGVPVRLRVPLPARRQNLAGRTTWVIEKPYELAALEGGVSGADCAPVTFPSLAATCPRGHLERCSHHCSRVCQRFSISSGRRPSSTHQIAGYGVVAQVDPVNRESGRQVDCAGPPVRSPQPATWPKRAWEDRRYSLPPRSFFRWPRCPLP